MGIVEIVNAALVVLGQINAGTDLIISFYQRFQSDHPTDLPELSDAEVILRSRGKFTANREEAEAALADLRAQGVIP